VLGIRPVRSRSACASRFMAPRRLRPAPATFSHPSDSFADAPASGRRPCLCAGLMPCAFTINVCSACPGPSRLLLTRSSVAYACWALTLRAHRSVSGLRCASQCHCVCARGGALTRPSPSQAVVD
ncbi:uncharacterized protein B0H18DRAFT_985171, partial [Fomitopsis serialis]|uniref:uncharacterized protein n=1 Tax=Fomitopsis serialis TaxID=139415 RepID=UPI002008DA23